MWLPGAAQEADAEMGLGVSSRSPATEPSDSRIVCLWFRFKVKSPFEGHPKFGAGTFEFRFAQECGLNHAGFQSQRSENCWSPRTYPQLYLRSILWFHPNLAGYLTPFIAAHLHILNVPCVYQV